MRSRTADWFEVKIRYDKTQEDGLVKAVTESYTVDALTFTEAEANITKEMKPYISGEYQIKAIARASYHEVFFSDIDKDDKYFKVKVAFVTIDEKTEKEKRSNVYYLFQGNNPEEVNKYIKEAFEGTMMDYEVSAIVETKILDVYEHSLDDKPKTEDKKSEDEGKDDKE